MARTTGPPGASRRRPRLSREEIIEAALALIDDEGLEKLSMRRLGARLGVEAMALYRYVDGRRDLLDGVTDLLLERLREGAPPGDDWREGLAAFARRYRRLTLEHPNAAPLLPGRPERSYVAARDLAERLLGRLVRAGFTEPDAMRAVRLVSRLVVGLSAGPPVPDGDEADDAALAGDDHPLVRGLLADLRRPDRGKEELFEFGLALILDGLETRRGAPGARTEFTQ